MKIKNFLFKVVLLIFLTVAFSKSSYASSDISLNQKEIDAIVSELKKYLNQFLAITLNTIHTIYPLTKQKIITPSFTFQTMVQVALSAW